MLTKAKEFLSTKEFSQETFSFSRGAEKGVESQVFHKKFTSWCFLLFCSLGSGMGKRPWLTIILSIAVCLVCSAGMVFWQVNTDDEAMWTPYGSSVSKLLTRTLHSYLITLCYFEKLTHFCTFKICFPKCYNLKKASNGLK